MADEGDVIVLGEVGGKKRKRVNDLEEVVEEVVERVVEKEERKADIEGPREDEVKEVEWKVEPPAQLEKPPEKPVSSYDRFHSEGPESVRLLLQGYRFCKNFDLVGCCVLQEGLGRRMAEVGIEPCTKKGTCAKSGRCVSACHRFKAYDISSKFHQFTKPQKHPLCVYLFIQEAFGTSVTGFQVTLLVFSFGFWFPFFFLLVLPSLVLLFV